MLRRRSRRQTQERRFLFSTRKNSRSVMASVGSGPSIQVLTMASTPMNIGNSTNNNNGSEYAQFQQWKALQQSQQQPHYQQQQQQQQYAEFLQFQAWQRAQQQHFIPASPQGVYPGPATAPPPQLQSNTPIYAPTPIVPAPGTPLTINPVGGGNGYQQTNAQTPPPPQSTPQPVSAPAPQQTPSTPTANKTRGGNGCSGCNVWSAFSTVDSVITSLKNNSSKIQNTYSEAQGLISSLRSCQG